MKKFRNLGDLEGRAWKMDHGICKRGRVCTFRRGLLELEVLLRLKNYDR
jgi:hypothetical protein